MTEIITLESFNAAIAPRAVASNESNQKVIDKLASAGCPASAVPEFLAAPESNTKDHILRVFSRWYFAKNGAPAKAPRAPKKPETTPETTPATAPAVATPAAPVSENNGPSLEALEALGAAINSVIKPQSTPASTIDESFMKHYVDNRIAEELQKHQPAVIEIKVLGNTRPLYTSAHYMLEDVLTDLVNGENAYIYGPAGTGKTVLAQQAAEALGVPFYFTSKIDEVFQLTGFIDASGHYNETELYRCMQTGGVFLFDEMDASAPEALTAFNALLVNGIMDFPCGKVNRPENMYIIGAGNTDGSGGTSEYNTRCKIDEATRNRFTFEKVGYDPAIENAIAESFEDKETAHAAVDVVRTIRAFSERNGLEITASYRDITRLAKLAGAKGIEKTVRSCILNKLSNDDIQTMKRDREMVKLAQGGNAFAAAICAQ